MIGRLKLELQPRKCTVHLTTIINIIIKYKDILQDSRAKLSKTRLFALTDVRIAKTKIFSRNILGLLLEERIITFRMTTAKEAILLRNREEKREIQIIKQGQLYFIIQIKSYKLSQIR